MSNSLLLNFGSYLIAFGLLCIFLAQFEVKVNYAASGVPTVPLEFRLSITEPGDYTMKVFSESEYQFNRVR